MEMYIFDFAEETGPLFFPLFFILRSSKCVILKKYDKDFVVKTNYINYSMCFYVKNIKLLLYMSCH